MLLTFPCLMVVCCWLFTSKLHKGQTGEQFLHQCSSGPLGISLRVEQAKVLGKGKSKGCGLIRFYFRAVVVCVDSLPSSVTFLPPLCFSTPGSPFSAFTSRVCSCSPHCSSQPLLHHSQAVPLRFILYTPHSPPYIHVNAQS